MTRTTTYSLLGRIGAVAALAAGSLATVLAGSAAAAPSSWTWSSSGSWTVPAGVTQISVTVTGGGGGASANSWTGEAVEGDGGDTESALFTVTPGATVTIAVGGPGGDSAGSTAGAGGSGSSAGMPGEDGGSAACSAESGPVDCPGGGGGGGETAVSSSGWTISAKGGNGATGLNQSSDGEDPAPTGDAGGTGGGSSDCSGNITGCVNGGTSNAGGPGSVVIDVTSVATMTTVAAVPNPVEVGSAVTLTATVSNVFDASRPPSQGSVSFNAGTTSLCTATSLTVGSSASTASCTTSSLALGTTEIEATFSGSGATGIDYSFGSSFGTVNQVVTSPQPTVTTTSSSQCTVSGAPGAMGAAGVTGPALAAHTTTGSSDGATSHSSTSSGGSTQSAAGFRARYAAIADACGQTSDPGTSTTALTSGDPVPTTSGPKGRPVGHAVGVDPTSGGQYQAADPELANTGVATGTITALAAAMLLLGGALVAMGSRYRRRQFGSAAHH